MPSGYSASKAGSPADKQARVQEKDDMVASSAQLNVDELVDGQKFRRFNLNLLIWSFLAMFADGFEISALGIAAPHMVRDWGVGAASMGPMMGASLLGILVGAPLFGFLGDRYGRRLVILLGCFLFGITTLAVVVAENIEQITALRVLTGIGMGGLMPNAIALNSELSPRHLRAKLVILMFMGVTLGGAVPGFVGAWLVPAYGWKILFLIGGIFPLIVCAGLLIYLPESVKFLATRPGRESELLRILRRMRPDLALGDGTSFVRPPVSQAGQGSIAPLFSGGLAAITLLLWLCFATTLMANYFLNSWMAVLFEAKGISPEAAAMTTTAYHLGAAFGGLAMSMLLDRWGFLAVTGMLAVAAPALLSIGLPNLPPALLALLVGLAGFCVLGAQFGSNAAAGIIYPTAYRSKGVGLAFAVGRIGSVLGPIIGAILIGLELPIMVLLLAIAGPILLGAFAAFLLGRLSHRRFGGWQLDEAPPERPALATAEGMG
jgi:AAHS family 4-hydroxybenzoate transporter-like MFS transporter